MDEVLIGWVISDGVSNTLQAASLSVYFYKTQT